MHRRPKLGIGVVDEVESGVELGFSVCWLGEGARDLSASVAIVAEISGEPTVKGTLSNDIIEVRCGRCNAEVTASIERVVEIGI